MCYTYHVHEVIVAAELKTDLRSEAGNTEICLKKGDIKMASKRSGRRRSAAIVSVITVLVCVVVFALAIGMIFKILKDDGSSSSAPSSSDISSVSSTDQDHDSQSSDISSDLSSTTSSSVTPTSAKMCYLTFDDGPSDNTPKILDILDQYGIKATFFVIGNAGKVYPTYLTEIVNRGHTIALHSYSHEYDEIYASEEAFYKDLDKLDSLVYNWTGVRTKVIRFPGGTSNMVSKKYCPGIMTALSKSAVEKGYNYFDWNAMCGDAEYVKGHYPHSVEELMDYVKQSSTSTSACVLLHDTNDKKTTVDALPQIIEYYKSFGYEFDALNENVTGFRHKANN